jgi:outer membrane lipoprotein SlyB
MKRILLLAALPAILSLMTGCGPNVSPNTYEASESGVASKVVSGIVVGKRAVKVDAKSGLGGLAGAGMGAAGASAIGGSPHANIAAGIGGAVIGGVLGNAVDKAAHSHKAFEYIINLKNGSTISIAQVQEVEFEVGQSVLVIYGAMTRIVPDNTIRPVDQDKPAVKSNTVKRKKTVTRNVEKRESVEKAVNYNEI